MKRSERGTTGIVAGLLAALALAACSGDAAAPAPGPAPQPSADAGGDYTVRDVTHAADGHATVVLAKGGGEEGVADAELSVALYGDITGDVAAELVNFLASTYPSHRLQDVSISSEQPSQWTVMTTEEGSGGLDAWGYRATIVREQGGLRIVGVTTWMA